ncbi:MAG: bifunctional phosphopantothenoylcysteine decarboxylase/phosphopantothenate--cysteine ligase CoaBC [Anaerolineales bacterium]|nr:MAG: bifunctional phosphopantothenoylcysteine decarboxylase/phosphopantothenate--cysteine ligase CoaBC [Anaerolineales bacterium]
MSIRVLKDKRVLLGVTGGVAAYKAAILASRLTQVGVAVDVVLTEAATRFVAPLTFQAVTQRPVYTDLFELEVDPGSGELSIPHIALAKAADLLLIAPATGNTLAKLAHGIADNLLTNIALATPAPLLIAPAMESDMWAHPATQTNVATLTERGVTVVGPTAGHLASGAEGVGRMSEPAEILEMARVVLGQAGDLEQRRVVVSAGGTREAIDPVRFISNRSSGKMGYALALAARDRGAQVTLVTAPTSLSDPVGLKTVQVESAAQMRDAILAASSDADALVMAAAVSDYRPIEPAHQKIKKGEEGLTLQLSRTPDILAEMARLRELGRGPKIVVGFAAETQDLLVNARDKLQRKRLDLIAANDVSAADAGFSVDTNRVTLLSADGTVDALPLMSKEEVADEIWDRVCRLWETG